MATLPQTPGGFVSDIILWIRRIIKSTSDQSITDSYIGDMINRFYTYEMPERLQLFELKRQYTFETIPNQFIYQFPYQQYQKVESPIYVDGVQIGLLQSNDQFYKLYPEFVNNEQPILGDGTSGPYSITFGKNPVLRAFIDDLGNLLPYVYITATDTSGEFCYIVDSGFLNPSGEGILIETDASFQTILGPSVADGGSGSVNYLTGVATFTFLNNIGGQQPIYCQSSPYSPGTPRICLFFNNTLKLYPVPDRAYKVQMDAFITPAQFLSTEAAVPFAYMAEYIARGATRKILSDNADYEQFQFYEPLFREQENLVLRRTQRTNDNERTPTIFSSQTNNKPWMYTQY